MKQDKLAPPAFHVLHLPALVESQDVDVPAGATVQIGYGEVEVVNAAEFGHGASGEVRINIIRDEK
jgi:hypothetical protein